MDRFESISQALIEELLRHREAITSDPYLRSIQVVVEIDRGYASVSASLKSSRPRQALPERNLVQRDP